MTTANKLFRTLLFSLMILVGLGAVGQGLDVSHYQGTINWKKVKQSGKVTFVYIKATEGASIKDSQYKKYIKDAKAAGLKVGSYHLYSSKTTAYEQFANFKSVVKKSEQDLIPVLDIEERHSAKLYIARVDKLLELMEKTYGCKPMIYTSEAVYYRHFNIPKYKKYHFFISRYKGTPKSPYTLWQYTERGSVSGCNGYVDLSKFAKNHSLSDIQMRKKKN